MNDNFVFREATLADIEGVQSCVNAAYYSYKDEIDLMPAPLFDDYQNKIISDDVFVIENKSQIVAILILVLKKTYLLLDNIAVHPDFQKNGLARYLLEAAEIKAQKLGYEEIQLYTNEKMINNIQIYTHIGYSELARKKESGYSRVYFRKKIMFQ